ncbi:MAG: hypothetical protein JXA18_01430, partial [Chitinispirillaceae bacterium]|nr:hypothetical protein [Chitinispirillaceae bacterium]
MKYNFKAVCATIACCGAVFSAGAQINLKSNDITFRTYSNAARNTVHYGDLTLDGGSSGCSRGGLYCNRVAAIHLLTSYDDCNVYNDLTVYDDFTVVPPGSKNFIHPHPTDTTKMIKYICIEAGEAMTMTRGLS